MSQCSVYESFCAESLSQLWMHKLHLVNDILLPHKNMIVGYDDGCHYHAYVTNPKRALATAEAKILTQHDVVIDDCHLRGQ